MNVEVSTPLLGPRPIWPIEIVRGRNDRVWCADGRMFYDFYGGHAVALTGHAHRRVRRAVARQMRQLIFYSTSAELAVRNRAVESLVQRLPPGLGQVFFSNSGAEANENALKIALKLTGRNRLLAFQGSFHGRTLLALSVTDDPALRDAFRGLGPMVDFLPFADPRAIEEAAFDSAAAVILEPIQSMGGIRMADQVWYRRLIERAHKNGCLVIFDEIQTGLGRTGRWFFAGDDGIVPDILTLAKGLGSGIPVAATALRADLAASLKPHDLGSTFGGGPTAMAAVLATLEVLDSEHCIARAESLGARLAAGIRAHPEYESLGRGLLIGLRTQGPSRLLGEQLFRQGFLVGASRDPCVLRLLPPLTLRERSVDRFLDALDRVRPS
ncbi:MAG: aspartate aminotransferase family protein [Gammaproteobacteria bacterium]